MRTLESQTKSLKRPTDDKNKFLPNSFVRLIHQKWAAALFKVCNTLKCVKIEKN